MGTLTINLGAAVGTLTINSCPFCAYDKCKTTSKRRGKYRREGENYQVLCGRCKARGPIVQDSEIKAIELWNRRPLPREVLTALLKQVNVELDRVNSMLDETIAQLQAKRDTTE